MTIGTLLARTASAGADGLTGTLDGTGADSFTVGGTLSVIAAQVAGTYAGTFDVTVAYN
jgi:spore coat protein U-like protein